MLNFAHGAIGMVGAYVEWEVQVERTASRGRRLVGGTRGVCALIGALTHLLVMRQLRRASPLARIVATLGVLIVLQSSAIIRYGARVTFVESELPTTLCRTRSGSAVSVDRFILLGIAAVLSVRAVGAVPLHEVRHGDRGGGREPARRVGRRAVARPDRHRQLGARVGARRPGRDPDRPDRHAAGRRR